MTAFKPLRGVISPTLTPFNDDLTIAEDLYIAHAKRCLADGCVGLAPFGTTSEALSVGIDERMDMLEKLAASGIAPAQMIPGTGLTNLPDTIRLTRHAVELGCAGAMTLPPFYFKNVPDDGLYDYFRRLIDGVADDRGFPRHHRRHQGQHRRLGQHLGIAGDRGAAGLSGLGAAADGGAGDGRHRVDLGHRQHQRSRHRRGDPAV
jgi:hypothetical protein